MDYRIALLKGDGIGPVLASYTAEFLRILGKRHGFRAHIEEYPFGKAAYEQTGSALPETTRDGILAADAALAAAVDGKGIPGTTPVGLLRRELDLFADVRPIRSRPGRWCLRPDLDMVMIREVTQGFLSDRNLARGNGEWMSDRDTAFSLRVITYQVSRRIADYAFAFAGRHGRRKITALHKEPIFRMTCGTFLRACRDAAAGHPEIDYEEELVDSAANGLIAHPERYDVILTTNLFGDILSDEMAALVSSMAPGANYGPKARVYLPVTHAPAYGKLEKDEYDPVPALLSLVMVLEDLEENSAAAALNEAVDRVLRDAPVRASALLHAIQSILEEDGAS